MKEPEPEPEPETAAVPVSESLGKALSAASGRIRNTRQYSAYVREREGQSSRYQALSGCGAFVAFRDYATGQTRVQDARWCKRAIECPFCAAGRGAKLSTRLADRAIAWLAGNPSDRPYHLVLTVRAGDDWRGQFDLVARLLSSQVKLRLQVRKRGRGSSALAPFSAGASSIELKRGKGGGVHVHVHTLAMAPPGLTKWDVLPAWNQAAGYETSVALDPCYGHRDGVPLWDLLSDGFDPNDKLVRDALMKSLLEIAKYPVKFSGLPDADRYVCGSVLKGARLFRSWGGFRGLKVPDDWRDSGSDLEGVPYWVRFYQYNAAAGRLEQYRARHVDPNNPAPFEAFDFGPYGS